MHADTIMKANIQLDGIEKSTVRLDVLKGRDPEIMDEVLFMRLLCLERKRAERSKKKFVLMLIDAKKAIRRDRRQDVCNNIITALSLSTRETDIIGWYEEDSVLGVIFTEIGEAQPRYSLNALIDKAHASLRNNLDSELFIKIQVSFHLFPEEWDEGNQDGPADLRLYPELVTQGDSKRSSRFVKRVIDVAVSLLALLLLAPVFLIISMLIKLTSKGPVLFRQERVGEFGKRFQFLKFRSMYEKNDHSIHKSYVEALIAGKANGGRSNGHRQPVYKLQNDPRITPIGKFLRKSSLDELPQFWNVLKGEMSLVGPRPPIPYEVASYDIWHRRRILEAKPGITGLWQVRGRSSTTFDEMVRIDLEYVRGWSLGLDLKILLQTPRAIFSCDGAY